MFILSDPLVKTPVKLSYKKTGLKSFGATIKQTDTLFYIILVGGQKRRSLSYPSNVTCGCRALLPKW